MKQIIIFILIVSFSWLDASADNGPSKKINAAAAVIKLSVTEQNNMAVISWTAFKTNNVRRFELEKSNDGVGFNYVSAVAAGKKNSFSVEDRNLMEGSSYYRLRIVDNSGNIIYSKTAAIEKKTTAAPVKIMPGAVAEELYVWLPANTQVAQAEITDVTGRKAVDNVSITNFSNVASLEVGSLPAGMYKINLITSTGETANLKFAKK